MAAGGVPLPPIRAVPPACAVPPKKLLKLENLNTGDLEKIKEIKPLGSGIYASVYDYGNLYAIKIANDNDENRQMLTTEYERYKSLKDTESFPKIINYGEGYLIMEKLEKTLLSLIKENPNSPYNKVYFYHMVNAVKKCHDERICNHDIKNDNFMKEISPSLRIKLLDFGLSHTFNETIKATPIDVAKELSRPPEILVDFNCNGKYDIFMLGACLFELESGRSPFENTHDDILWTTFKKDKEQFWKWNEQTGFKPLQNFKELFEE